MNIPAGTKPSVKVHSIDCIGLSPVSWGDGFMRDVSILAIKTRCGKTALGSAYTSAKKLKTTWDKYGSLIDFSELNPNQTQAWVNAATLLPDNQGFDGQGNDTIPALSAINIALWDLLGQCLNQSVASLCGGQHWKNLPAYASLEIPYQLHGPDQDYAQRLKNMDEKGFKAIKLYIPKFGYRDNRLTQGQWKQLEANYLREARRILGDDVALMLDTFGSASDWPDDLSWAKDIGQILKDNHYLWFEEPLSPKHPTQGYHTLKQLGGIKISGGEFFTSPQNFIDWVAQGTVDILQPDCTISGGLSTLIEVRNHATPKGINVIPHGWSSAVGLAADIHFLASAPKDTFLFLEYMPTPHVTELLRENPFSLNPDGTVSVPTGPGLGIELDWQKVEDKKFPFSGEIYTQNF